MKTVEGSKAFPYIAWSVVIIFSFFTYYLSLELMETAAYLEGKTELSIDVLESV